MRREAPNILLGHVIVLTRESGACPCGAAAPASTWCPPPGGPRSPPWSSTPLACPAPVRMASFRGGDCPEDQNPVVAGKCLGTLHAVAVRSMVVGFDAGCCAWWGSPAASFCPAAACWSAQLPRPRPTAAACAQTQPQGLHNVAQRSAAQRRLHSPSDGPPQPT